MSVDACAAVCSCKCVDLAHSSVLTYVYICIYTHIYLCECVYVNIYINIFMNTYIERCIYIHVYIWLKLCVFSSSVQLLIHVRRGVMSHV